MWFSSLELEKEAREAKKGTKTREVKGAAERKRKRAAKAARSRMRSLPKEPSKR